MKKAFIIVCMLVFLISITGCKRDEVVAMPEEVSSNTLLVQASGVVQLAIVEEFDKDYYSISELKDFSQKQVDAYNQSRGRKVVVLSDAKESKGKAILFLKFENMDEYAAYNGREAYLFDIENANTEQLELLPENMTVYKKKKSISKQDIVNGKGLKAVVIDEAYDILFEGKILYYSENIEIYNKHKVQTIAEQKSVIVYK